MRSKVCLSLLVLIIGFSSMADIEDVWRLYDLTPVSTNNPVLASVPECRIEIPASEFRAYINSAFIPNKEGKTMTPADKREKLQSLVDDYFWVWRGYSEKADVVDREIHGMLAITRDEAMKALFIEQEADARVKSLEEYEKLKGEIRDRLFDQAEIHVSSTAYAVLTNAIASTNGGGTSLSAEDRNLPLATCKVGAVNVGAFADIYLQMEPANRPDLSREDGVAKVLKELFADHLLLAAARERGLDRAEPVRTQVQADRTGLVRQWALDQVTRRAEEMTKAPDYEKQLKKWYKANLKTRYTTKNPDGTKHVIDFEKDRPTVQGDYFNDLQERLRQDELKKMRKGKKIQVDDKLLTQLVVTWPEPHQPAEMPSSLVGWDATTREFTARAGDTNVVLSFTMTNLSPYDLTIQDIHAVNEFITVESPPMPWTIKPGDQGTLRANVDLRNKKGTGYLPVEVTSSLGSKTLTLKITYYGK
ncbi:MAG TPA: DUF1573 domain-containing protein [Desulfuromonadaceae bacterium]|nr:DUF1573 domain-containing protein [Desulfuromonadaceae bacterium]